MTSRIAYLPHYSFLETDLTVTDVNFLRVAHLFDNLLSPPSGAVSARGEVGLRTNRSGRRGRGLPGHHSRPLTSDGGGDHRVHHLRLVAALPENEDGPHSAGEGHV